MGKKLTSIFLILLIVVSSCINVNAENSNTLELNLANEYLLSKGYPQMVISVLPEEEIIQLANALEVDPVNNSLSWNVMVVDNLEEIQTVVNLDDSELIQCGLTIEEIQKCRNQIEKTKNCSDGDLQKTYNMTKDEINVLRKALEKNSEFKRKAIIKKATISGSITSSEMIYTQAKYSTSSTNPSYTIAINYEWLKPYYWDVFDDVIVAGWGGNLNHVNNSSKSEYYNISGLAPFFSYTTYYTSSIWNSVETPNKGVTYSSPQSRMNGILTTRMRSGHVNFRIYQTSFQGYDTNIVSQYAHKVVAIGGGSISITGPSITFGTAYDTGTQISHTIRY
ncbi:MAG: hypothetical protein K0R15_2096 [Clostridiales bacterium]|jgi:hypothetical protein|nr:hypothetical protein [Clostridiales bacterium]